MAALLTLALFAGLSASSPALADSFELRDPFAPRVVVSGSATVSSGLLDPFTRPQPTSIARTSTQTQRSDPFAARRPGYGLRDPFAAPAPAPRLAAAESATEAMVDPFEVRRPERASNSSSQALRDPFAR